MDRKTTTPAYAELSIPELLRQLSGDTATLVRQEMLLARAELTEKGKQAGVSVGAFGASAILALGAFGALTATLILLLSLVLQPWAAALIVTLAYGAAAFVSARLGKKKLDEMATPVPQETVESVKDDVAAVRSGIARGR
jgi:hypothetical protein